jgi:hypothetical protein
VQVWRNRSRTSDRMALVHHLVISRRSQNSPPRHRQNESQPLLLKGIYIHDSLPSFLPASDYDGPVILASDRSGEVLERNRTATCNPSGGVLFTNMRMHSGFTPRWQQFHNSIRFTLSRFSRGMDFPETGEPFTFAGKAQCESHTLFTSRSCYQTCSKAEGSHLYNSLLKLPNPFSKTHPASPFFRIRP